MGTGISIIRKNVNTAGNPGKRRLTNHPDFRHFASFFFPFASESAGSVESYDLIVIELIAKGFPEHIFKLIIQLVDSLDAPIWLSGLPVGTHGESTFDVIYFGGFFVLRRLTEFLHESCLSMRAKLAVIRHVVPFFLCLFSYFLDLSWCTDRIIFIIYLNQPENQ